MVTCPTDGGLDERNPASGLQQFVTLALEQQEPVLHLAGG
jgi:hypothetical protein